jgi:hypothetical protein
MAGIPELLRGGRESRWFERLNGQSVRFPSLVGVESRQAATRDDDRRQNASSNHPKPDTTNAALPQANAPAEPKPRPPARAKNRSLTAALTSSQYRMALRYSSCC